MGSALNAINGCVRRDLNGFEQGVWGRLGHKMALEGGGDVPARTYRYVTVLTLYRLTLGQAPIYHISVT